MQTCNVLLFRWAVIAVLAMACWTIVLGILEELEGGGNTRELRWD